MAVKVQFEIGHTSKLRSKKTHEGFTHDWELYVQGVNKSDISAFVEKVVFNLHDSFPKPKRALKEPPYVIKESGYAGFLLPIDIYFRNRDEPKRVQFTYDLDLQQTGPPQHRCEVQKFIFECPSEEFRQKLIKGGGIAVSGVVSGSGSTPTSVVNSEEGMVSKPKLSSDSSKKHKVRSDESKMNTFANLFGTPITKNNSKFSPDGKSSKSGINTGGAAVAGPSVNISNSNTGTMSGTSTSVSKDKPSKDKEKSNSGSLNTNNAEKVREKSEKKHKQSSPNKDTRSGDSKKASSISDGLKHEKRSEDKPKKEKSRDKDRDRSREKSNVSSGSKRSLSPKVGGREVGPSSPKRTTPPRPSSSASGRAEDAVKINKSDGTQDTSKSSKVKDQSSSSSGKKSKKEKKEKDRDKDKHSNSEHKHRTDTKSKDVNNAVASEKETKGITSGDVSKKTDKDIKADVTKMGNNKHTEKHNEKESNSISNMSSGAAPVTTEKKSTASAVEKDKKSHKHKKKDKSKDKDKEKDKDKIKEKDKDQIKDRDKDPATQVGETTLKTESNNTSTTVSSTTSTSSSSLSKKSQNKEKKSKDKLSKEEKKTRDEETNKNKQSKTTVSSNNSSVTTTTTSSTNNIELSDVDSIQSGIELPTSRSTATITTTHGQHSDSSNSSFPELQPKSSSQVPPSTGLPANRLPEATQTKDLKNTKEHKQSRNEKNTISGSSASVIKPNEKEEKKRRRNSTAVTTFIEPPLKQIRKESNKTVREKSKSPSLRSGRGNSSENTFLPPPSTNSATNSSGSSISSLSVANTNVASPAIASTSTNDSNSNNTQSNTTSSNISSNNNNPITTTLPMEYLTELQELHHKIMTLQDNEDLQQVVEMIAATGCYEITAKTFDFDLCKLDRNTVQRLQEFFATLVS